MKKVVAAVAFAAFGTISTAGVACEYNSASTSPVDLGMAPEPAATKVPATIVAKAPLGAKVKKTDPKANDGAKTPAAEQKVAASAEAPAQ